jgi:hypothetical protein
MMLALNTRHRRAVAGSALLVAIALAVITVRLLGPARAAAPASGLWVLQPSGTGLSITNGAYRVTGDIYVNSSAGKDVAHQRDDDADGTSSGRVARDLL